MKEIFFGILFFGGIAAVFLAQVIGVGVFLYGWGVDGLAVGAAAWSGFAIWLKLLIGGFVSLIIGKVGID